MSTLFSQIIEGKIPSFKLIENEFAYAFMDIFPLRRGHVLVVPKIEVDLVYNLDDTYYTETFLMAKKIAKALAQVIPCERIGYSVIGLEVPHAHIHLVPINTANDINFAQDKLDMSKEEIQSIAHQIKQYLNE